MEQYIVIGVNVVSTVVIMVAAFVLLSDTRNEPFLTRLSLIVVMFGGAWCLTSASDQDWTVGGIILRIGIATYMVSSVRVSVMISDVPLEYNTKIVRTILVFNEMLTIHPNKRIILFDLRLARGKVMEGLPVNGLTSREREPFRHGEWLRYQDVATDAEYVSMVKVALRSGICRTIVPDVEHKNEPLLHGIYRGIGVRESDLYIIRKSSRSIMFITVASDEEIGDSPYYREEMRPLVDKVRNIFAIKPLLSI